MSDLLVANIDLKVFRNITTPPSAAEEVASAVIREALQQQLNLAVVTAHNFELAANAVGVAIPSLPSAPYDGILFIYSSIEIRANINSQGYQRIKPGGFVTMASTSTVLFTNDIIAPGETAVIAANVRYFAGKLA